MNRMSTQDDPPVAAPVEPEEFSKFVGQLNLQNVWLSKAQVENLEGPLPPGDAHMNIRGAAEWNLIDGGFRALQQFVITLTKEDHVSMRAEVSFGLDFLSERPMTEALFELFRVPSLILMAWPYLREFVGSLISRMNWSGYTIPTMVIQPISTTPGAPAAGPTPQPKAARSRRSKAPVSTQ